MAKKTTPTSDLLKARRKLKIKRQEAAERLNLPPELLKAFDDWSFEDLPELHEPLHVSLRRYARLLDVPSSGLVSKLPPEHQKSTTQFTKRKGLFFMSRAGYLVVLGLIVAVFLGFIGWRAIRANAIPELTIINPEPNAVLDISRVEINGRTSEGAQVFINGNSVPVETNGEFSGQVILAPGPNNVEVRAINSFARENIQNRTFIRTTP
ncbi:MAG: helix-turn-helix domain-containing protein [Candidatus Saccharimonadales bacterium]|nr:helix-turn-helix domain-containing protein [Candidatus Saccharimonadales bacterium]